MNIGRKKKALRESLISAWTLLEASVARLQGDCEIKPPVFDEIFVIEKDDKNSMKVDIRPVVFRVTETAKLKSMNLYVFMRGKVHFTITSYDPFMACYFSTYVGYFRELNPNKLIHTLGIHYDYDDRTLGHPIYHAQVENFGAPGLAAINSNFGTSFVLHDNLMEHTSKTVRLPTAHMDPLSVFVQILADHLLNTNADDQQAALFEDTRKALMFFDSDSTYAGRLNDASRLKCYRGARWYPTKQELAARQTAATAAAAAAAAATAAAATP